MAITVAASFYFLLVELTDGQRLAPVAITVSLQGLGILLQLVAKIHLGRSFALLPANRGVVCSGPYKWVRHPIYLGYLLVHIGFLLSVWSIFNLCVWMNFLSHSPRDDILSMFKKFLPWTNCRNRGRSDSI